MATRVISTSLKVEGEQEFKKQMGEVNSNLRTLKSEVQLTTEEFKGQANSMEALEAKSRILNEQVDQQKEKVRALEKALEEAGDAFKDNPKKIDEYQQSLNRAKADLIKMERELDTNNGYLVEAQRSFDKTAKSIDEFGNSVKDADGENKGLKSFVSNLGDLKRLIAGGAVVAGVKEMTDAILGVVESTEEYRRIMGTLETSSAAAGYSAEETTEAYNRLYGVLGDTQTAATTVANLQAIGLSQTDLMTVVDAATGAWATYGDSIPIDGLAESINETIKAGQVTGTFADILNWGSEENQTFGLTLKENIEFEELSEKQLEKLNDEQRTQYEATKAQYEATEEFNEALNECKTAEDYFNLALQECQTETERTNLVTKMLSDQGLSELGNAWRENNQDIVEMNEAQAELEAAMGRIGELLTPLASKLVSFGADALEFVTDKAKAAVDWFGKLIDKINDWQENQNRKAFENRGLEYPGSVDGSHAGGLSRVPYNGYIAELHKDESVLTASEAATWRRMQSEIPVQRQGVSQADLQGTVAAAVNAISTAQQGNLGGDLIVELSVNGEKFSKAILTDFRNVSRASPEVTNDT